MASQYTSSLQIQKIGNGEQSGVWGSSTNTNWDLVDNAIAGVVSITMLNADYTLSTANGVYDEARNMVIVASPSSTNTAIRKIIIPAVTKMYMVVNSTSGGYAITIGTSGGLAATIPNGTATMVYCDGSNTYAGVTGTSGAFTVGGNLAVSGTSTLTGQTTAAGALTAYTTATSTSSTISGTTLTIGGTITGTYFAGQILTGSGITANTTIVNQLTGTAGGAGTYTISVSHTIGTPQAINGSTSVLSTNQLVTGNSAIGGTLAVTGTSTLTGAITAGADATFTGTGQVKLPNGTTAQRSASPTYGMMRYNTTTNQFEGYDGTAGETISSITHITTQATVTTAVAHGLTTGTFVVITGASPSEYNGTYSITYASDTTFTYSMATSPATNATVVGSYTYGTWGSIAGTGTVAGGAIYQNAQTITANYTIDSTQNAGSFGPITINSGVTVTVPSTSTWTVT